MRLFTAIEIPPEAKDNLRVALERLRPTAKLSWSPVENLHVTTKFIGEWPEQRLDEMIRALSDVPFPDLIDITIQGLGWFPNPRNPRVFWAGVAGGEPLRALALATEQAVEKLGVPVEQREYSPHLTLARLKERLPLDLLRSAIAALPSDHFGSFRAAAFHLYLSKAGKYTQLATFPSYSGVTQPNLLQTKV